jgi:hypothetical protein
LDLPLLVSLQLPQRNTSRIARQIKKSLAEVAVELAACLDVAVIATILTMMIAVREAEASMLTPSIVLLLLPKQLLARRQLLVSLSTLGTSHASAVVNDQSHESEQVPKSLELV